MNIYDTVMSPLETKILGEVRRTLIGTAKGKVLEIGIGTGANLDYYKYGDVSEIIGLDIKLSDKIKSKKVKGLSLMESSAEKLPFATGSFDTVVATLVLCSVKDVSASLCEIKRVLKPGGTYIFIEHILPTGKGIAAGFNIVNPLWASLTCGCNINRKTNLLIKKSGFSTLTIKKRGKDVFCYGTAVK